MRVLMVHGFTQNAAVFSSRTSNVRRKALKIPGAGKSEFVFAESPLQVHPSMSPDQSAIADQRAWCVSNSAHWLNAVCLIIQCKQRLAV